MPIKVITPPTLSSILTTAELRAQCRIDGTDLDGPLVLALAGAHAHAQHYTGTSIGVQALELVLDAFPVGDLPLPQGPVNSVTSITYTDTAGDPQTLDSGAYELDSYTVPALVSPVYGTSWPDTLATSNAVKVRYSAGTSDPAVKQALLLLVAHYIANPSASAQAQSVELVLGVQSLLDTVRDWSA